MKRAKWLAVCLAGAVLVGGACLTVHAARGDGTKKGGAARAGRKGRRPVFDYAAIGAEAGLSAEQTEKVTGLVLYYQFMLSLQRVRPEDDQKAKIKALCAEAAKPVLSAANPRAQAEVLAGLVEKVRGVLNEEQKGKFRPPFSGGRKKKSAANQ